MRARTSATRLIIVRAALAGTLLATCAVACGKKGPKLHPVHGQVLFDGTAPEGAIVVFQPVDAQSGESMASGTVGSDGRFRLATYPHGEGAFEGEYIVLITWLPADGRQVQNPKNLLPEKYADASQPVFRATVKPGTNDLEPFVLTK